MQPAARNAVWDDVQELIDESIAELPDDLQFVVVEHYLMGRTMESLGEELGISKQAVSQRARKGIEGIRSDLRGKGVMASVAVLSAGISELASAEAAPGLVSGLLKAAVGGVDGEVLAGAAVEKASALARSA